MQEIYLNDAKIPYEHAAAYFKEAADWAKEHCASYAGYNVQDVSDVSYHYDNVALYLFESEKDALVFKLRWVQ